MGSQQSSGGGVGTQRGGKIESMILSMFQNDMSGSFISMTQKVTASPPDTIIDKDVKEALLKVTRKGTVMK